MYFTASVTSLELRVGLVHGFTLDIWLDLCTYIQEQAVADES